MESENAEALPPTDRPSLIRSLISKAEKHPTAATMCAGFVVAAIGASAAFFGSLWSAETSLRITQAQLDHDSSRKVQEQRDATYRDYLSAASSYRNAAAAMFSRQDPKDINATASEFMAARAKYQAQINELYVYGSDKAWEAHQLVASTIPPALGTTGLSFKASDVSDEKSFIAAYNGFLEVRCQEVATEVRSGCAD